MNELAIYNTEDISERIGKKLMQYTPCDLFAEFEETHCESLMECYLFTVSQKKKIPDIDSIVQEINNSLLNKIISIVKEEDKDGEILSSGYSSFIEEIFYEYSSYIEVEYILHLMVMMNLSCIMKAETFCRPENPGLYINFNDAQEEINEEPVSRYIESLFSDDVGFEITGKISFAKKVY